MKILHNNVTADHNAGSDGEGPYRVKGFEETVSTESLKGLHSLAEQLINVTHTPRYAQKIRGACKSKSELAEVQLSQSSYEAMVVSATLAILAAKDQCFAVTRPPGHHASKEKAEGFCFFNNVAIATNYLLQQGKRVCIIDIDGHHGNGTQSIFRDEERVLFSSIHQEGKYPYSGLATDVGEGPSLKKVINIPVPTGSGDDVFLKALAFIVERARSFDPDHIAVSAGFDGYFQDKIVQLNYSKRGYYEAGKLIVSLNKPTFAVLEGGYHEEVKSCVEALVAGMSRDGFDTKEEFSNSSKTCTASAEKTMCSIVALLDRRSN